MSFGRDGAQPVTPFPRVRSVPIRSDPPVRRVLLRALAYTATVIFAVVGLLPLLAITGVLTMIGGMSAWAAHDRPVLAALAALLVLAVAVGRIAGRRPPVDHEVDLPTVEHRRDPLITPRPRERS